jgi:hypothetical protein
VRNKVIPLLQEYFFEDWSRIAAVLGDGFMQEAQILPPPGIEGNHYQAGRYVHRSEMTPLID